MLKSSLTLTRVTLPLLDSSTNSSILVLTSPTNNLLAYRRRRGHSRLLHSETTRHGNPGRGEDTASLLRHKEGDVEKHTSGSGRPELPPMGGEEVDVGSPSAGSKAESTESSASASTSPKETSDTSKATSTPTTSSTSTTSSHNPSADPTPASDPVPTPATQSPFPSIRPSLLHQSLHQHNPLPLRFGQNQTSMNINDATKLKLEAVVAEFKAVRWAVAYGSGVFGQDGYDPLEETAKDSGTEGKKVASTGEGKSVEGEKKSQSTVLSLLPKRKQKKPLVDFLIATSHPSHFHSLNLALHPTHYPTFARWLGSDMITRIQDWGAGIWYVTNVQVNGENIKYGVISEDALCEDLLDWSSVYVAGRMHKPVRIIKNDSRVLLAAQVNLASAIRVSLLMLPKEFKEVELWEKIAGLSYAGDPRMSIPGAENPKKVQNIVKPQIDRFRGLYGKLLWEISQDGVGVRGRRWVSWDELKGLSEEGRRERRMGMGMAGGVGIMTQQTDPKTRANLLKKLPRTLKSALEKRYQTILGVTLVKPELGEENKVEDDKTLPTDEFWTRVAGEKTLEAVMDDELRKIVRYPAISQTFKGFLTAGVYKSVRYASAKVGKWWKSKMEDIGLKEKKE